MAKKLKTAQGSPPSSPRRRHHRRAHRHQRQGPRAPSPARLSKLLADTYTLYLTTHNFHWNVTGPDVQLAARDVHDPVHRAVERGRPHRRTHPLAGPHRARARTRQFGALASVPDAPAKPPKALEMVRMLVERPRGRGAHRARHLPAGRQGRATSPPPTCSRSAWPSTSRPRGCCASLLEE